MNRLTLRSEQPMVQPAARDEETPRLSFSEWKWMDHPTRDSSFMCRALLGTITGRPIAIPEIRRANPTEGPETACCPLTLRGSTCDSLTTLKRCPWSSYRSRIADEQGQRRETWGLCDRGDLGFGSVAVPASRGFAMWKDPDAGQARSPQSERDDGGHPSRADWWCIGSTQPYGVPKVLKTDRHTGKRFHRRDKPPGALPFTARRAGQGGGWP